MCQNRFLKLITIVITIGVVLSTYLLYPHLQQCMPTYYKLAEDADRWGGKSVVLWVVGFQVVQVVISAILSCCPQMHNYPVLVAEDNRDSLYQESNALLARLSFLLSCVLLVAFICLVTGSQSIPVLLAPITLLGSVLLFVYYYHRIKSISK